MAHDRIVEDVSTEDALVTGAPLVGDVSIWDAIAASAPALTTMFIGQSLAPPEYQNFVMGGIVSMGVIGVIALAATPEHTSLSQYVSRFFHHKRRPNQVRYRPKGQPEDVLERSAIEYDERAQELTNIDRIFPRFDAVQRTDGTMVGVLKVKGANLDAADPQERVNAVNDATGFFDTGLDFDMTYFITTREFDATPHAELFREQYQKGAENNPVLRYHQQHHARWLENFLGSQLVREYYIIVPVTEQEIKDETTNDETVSSTVSDLPILGSILGGASSSDEDEEKMTAAEVRFEQLQTLNNRLNTIRAEFVHSIGDNANAERLSAAEYTALLKEFWEGESMSGRDLTPLVGLHPVSIGNTDKGDS